MRGHLQGITFGLIFPLLAISAIVAAAFSPLLEWREPVYIASGFAGIAGLVVLIFQPLLATAMLPQMARRTQQRIHRAAGLVLLISVVIHVAGLWVTSPPDVIDALTFSSPTLFTPFGVIAMWAVFLTAALFGLRKSLRLSPRKWRRLHLILAWLIVPGTVVHAMLIEGTMETITKTLLCVIAVAVLIIATRERLNRSRAQ